MLLHVMDLYRLYYIRVDCMQHIKLDCTKLTQSYRGVYKYLSGFSDISGAK